MQTMIPVVLGVHPRCGSTLVQRLLCCNHEGVVVWGEPPNGIEGRGSRSYGKYVPVPTKGPWAGWHPGAFINRSVTRPPGEVDFWEDILLGGDCGRYGIHHQLPCSDEALQKYRVCGDIVGCTETFVSGGYAAQMFYELYCEPSESICPGFGLKITDWRLTAGLVRSMVKAFGKPVYRIYVARDWPSTWKSWSRPVPEDGWKRTMMERSVELCRFNGFAANCDVAARDREGGVVCVNYSAITVESISAILERIGLTPDHSRMIRAFGARPN